MAVKQKSHGEMHNKHENAAKEIPVVKVESVAELSGLNDKFKRAIVNGKDGRERHFLRHMNPNNVLGGFVESTATVGSKAFVDKTSTVEEEALIMDGVRLINHSRAYGNAIIKGRSVLNNSEVFDDVIVSGMSLIKNSAISGNNTYHDARIVDEIKSTVN